MGIRRCCHTFLHLLLILHHGAVSSYSLMGKRIIVTGSSGGIGRGIALELASQGAHILVHYNTRQDGGR